MGHRFNNIRAFRASRLTHGTSHQYKSGILFTGAFRAAQIAHPYQRHFPVAGFFESIVCCRGNGDEGIFVHFGFRRLNGRTPHAKHAERNEQKNEETSVKSFHTAIFLLLLDF